MAINEALSDDNITLPWNGIRTLIFSKDRAMQLDACLSSLLSTCEEPTELGICVLYKASDSYSSAQYITLREFYPRVEFVVETSFYTDLLRILGSAEYILFIVDDCVFRKYWSIHEVIHSLTEYPDILGFSLRLGVNLTYCYSLDRDQSVPEHNSMLGCHGREILSFDWTRGEGDWGYPLEVSSSVYRSVDILQFLFEEPGIHNPNSLEKHLSRRAPTHALLRQRLSCYAEGVAFCIPFNLVQNDYFNRSVLNPARTVSMLAWLFDNGYRFDLSVLSTFVPNACHADCKLPLLLQKPDDVLIEASLNFQQLNYDARLCMERTTGQDVTGARLFNLTHGQGLQLQQNWLGGFLQLADHYIQMQSLEMVRSAGIFQTALKDFESKASITGEYLRTKEERCWELTDEISRLQNYMETVLDAKSVEVEELKTKLNILQEEFGAIQSSITWKIAMVLRSIIIRIIGMFGSLKHVINFIRRA